MRSSIDSGRFGPFFISAGCWPSLHAGENVKNIDQGLMAHQD